MKIADPLINEYCHGTSSALSMFLTTNGPKDQISPANKTKNIAELTLFFDITYCRILDRHHLLALPN